MRSTYDRFEITLFAGGLLASAAALVLPPARIALGVVDLFRWGGVLLLVQGLFRDLYLLRARTARAETSRVGLWLCVESGVGLLLLAQSFAFAALGVMQQVALPLAAWTLVVCLWWGFGYATRDLVMELKRDPDHLNLWLGIPRAPRTARAATPSSAARLPQRG